ncbi:MAG: c-type cytochrome [Alphaproteobacteria bacterium]|nr:c-type cytochrome [Alphaproteobacteria bacterium]
MRWSALSASIGLSMRRAALAGPLLAVAGLAQAADPPADLENGRAVARTWCAQCHAVERGESQRADGVPTFTGLANDPRNTSDRLRAFLTQPHGRMPDLSLSRQNRDDVIGYLLSLRDGRAGPTEPKPRRP